MRWNKERYLEIRSDLEERVKWKRRDSFRSKSINGLVSNISQERRKNWLIELVDRDSKRDFSFVDRSRWQSRYLPTNLSTPAPFCANLEKIFEFTFRISESFEYPTRNRI